MKSALRSEIRGSVKALSQQYVDSVSDCLSERLRKEEIFAKSKVVSCYLSMKGEVNTKMLIQSIFKNNQKIFIPKVTGKKSQDMFMFEVRSMEEMENFPKNNWGIPEPPFDLLDTTKDGVFGGLIDVIILPGVAFSPSCERLGHGKGYYDCFIERITKEHEKFGRAQPILIGLALDEQIVESVPTEAHDICLDYVVTPTTTYASGRRDISPTL